MIEGKCNKYTNFVDISEFQFHRRSESYKSRTYLDYDNYLNDDDDKYISHLDSFKPKNQKDIINMVGFILNYIFNKMENCSVNGYVSASMTNDLGNIIFTQKRAIRCVMSMLY